MKFQKKGENWEFQKKSYEITGGKKWNYKKNRMKFQTMREKIGICRFFFNCSGFDPIYLIIS